MVVLTLLQTVALPDPIDTIVRGPANTVVVQVENDLIAVELRTGQSRSVGKIDYGSQLVAVDARRRISFDNAGNLVVETLTGETESAKIAPRLVSLGSEVEFVAARQLGPTLILLLAASVGDPLDLGVPQFGFVAVDENWKITPISERWSSAPDIWFADPATNQLIVFPDIESEYPVALDATSGENALVPDGLGQTYRDYRITGMDISPDGQRLAISLWHDEKALGELRVAQIDAASTRLVNIFPNSSGVPVAPNWAPDGNSFMFRMETDRTTSAQLASLGADGEWQISPLMLMDPLGVSLWHGDFLVVQTDEAEITVLHLRQPE